MYGRVTRDPELRYSSNGDPVVKFTVAVDDGWGENKRTGFYDWTAFKRQAELIAEHFNRGNPILVWGRASQNKWEDKNGNTRTRIEFIVAGFDFTQPRAERDGGRQHEPAPTPEEPETEEESDVPF